jgi:outer membrane protein assembly factor BamA
MQGYAFVKVDVATTEGKVDPVIDLNFKITPKKKVYINRITITDLFNVFPEKIMLPIVYLSPSFI